jgi:hypothetical protein
MRTGRYSLAELFGNRHIEQLVIPEIQRDYVWEPKQAQHLLDSVLRNFERWRQERANPSLRVVTNAEAGLTEAESLRQEFADFYARRRYATNVGFVYAYCDADLPGQYHLIDGQQRLTTLYLALLAVAARDDELKIRFQARYTLGPSGDENGADEATSTKLDYRLREHTAKFLHRFVRYSLQSDVESRSIEEQSWCLRRFDNDVTVKNLIGNYRNIQSRLDTLSPQPDSASLYEYLEDLVECWYFDTNESSQGEELYLYLNARGESLTDNENRKAQLLADAGDPHSKETWGREWEEWQDYFWQQRAMGLSDKAKNPNADRGFNSFLHCIENLKRLRSG